jgi:hypothetical protein
MAALWTESHPEPTVAATTARSSLAHDIRAREKALPREQQLVAIASGSDEEIVAFVLARQPIREEMDVADALVDLRGENEHAVQEPAGGVMAAVQAVQEPAGGVMVAVQAVQEVAIPPGDLAELPERGSIYDGVHERGQRSMRGGKARHGHRGRSGTYLGGEARPTKAARAAPRAGADSMRPYTGVKGPSALRGGRIRVDKSKIGHDGGRISKAMATAMGKMAAAGSTRRSTQPGGGAPRKRVAKAKRSGPRPAKSSWLHFSAAARPKLKEANPSATFGELAAILGTAWRALSMVERAEFEACATADRARYAEERAKHAKTTEGSDAIEHLEEHGPIGAYIEWP